MPILLHIDLIAEYLLLQQNEESISAFFCVYYFLFFILFSYFAHSETKNLKIIGTIFMKPLIFQHITF
jgi:hypothetical protein